MGMRLGTWQFQFRDLFRLSETIRAKCFTYSINLKCRVQRPLVVISYCWSGYTLAKKNSIEAINTIEPLGMCMLAA